MDREDYLTYCNKCRSKIKIMCYTQEGFADYDKLKCPVCDTELGEYRDEGGYTMVVLRRGDAKNEK
jgi:hypothetical protein